MSLDTQSTDTAALPDPQPVPVSQNRHSQLQRLAKLTQIIAAAVLVLLIGVFAAFQIAERGQIRQGVTAFGVDLSGMNRDEARQALEDVRDTRSSESVWLLDGSTGWELTQNELGLSMDIDGALDDALAVGNEGFGPSRLALVWHFNDSTNVGADRIAVRGDVLTSQITHMAGEINQPTIDPLLEIHADGTHTYRNAQIGREVDVAGTSANILRGLAEGRTAAAIAINEFPPVADDAAYEHARLQAERVLDEPITMVAAGEEWTLTPDQLANRLRIVPPENGEGAMLKVDEIWVDDVVYEISWATDRSPRTPRVWWDAGGQLAVMDDGINGRDMDSDQARTMIQNAFLGLDDKNRIELPVATTPPPALPEDLNALGIRSLIGESSTPYGGGSVPERAHNIELAARMLNGTVVLPGQIFSFNAEIGPMTTDAGFQIAYGIANEGGDLRTVPSEAGGICQVASTVFQPVFWGGYQIETRNTHSYWIPSYTSRGLPGLDATVDSTTGLDFRWMNNTSTAVLIETVADGDNFTVRLYGTPPDWTVEVDPPEITNVVTANQEVVMQEDPTLPAGKQLRIESANDGFEIEIVRRVINSDGEVRELVLSAEYGPSRNVTLVGTGEDVQDA